MVWPLTTVLAVGVGVGLTFKLADGVGGSLVGAIADFFLKTATATAKPTTIIIIKKDLIISELSARKLQPARRA